MYDRSKLKPSDEYMTPERKPNRYNHSLFLGWVDMKKKDIKFLKQISQRIYEQNPKLFERKENHYNKFSNKHGKYVNQKKVGNQVIETKSPPGYVRREFDPVKSIYRKFAYAWDLLPIKERSHDFEIVFPKLAKILQDNKVNLVWSLLFVKSAK